MLTGDTAEAPADPETAFLEPAAAEDGAGPKASGSPVSRLQSAGAAPAVAEGASLAAETGELPAGGDSCSDDVTGAEDEVHARIPPSGAHSFRPLILVAPPLHYSPLPPENVGPAMCLIPHMLQTREGA